MINIEIKKPVKQVGLNSCFISFSKYNEGFIDTLRQLPSRNFDPKTKVWEVSIDRLPYLINSFKTEPINIKYSKEKCIKSSLPENFSFKTKPFGYQKTGVEYGLEHNSFILADEQGLGKALALDTKIYTYPTGYKLMKDIEVGDYVYGRDGKPTKVTATYYHKNVEMYRFTFSDGVSIDCCRDHLWKIHTQDGYKIVDTNWFLQKDKFGVIRKDKLFSGGSYKYYIDRCEPVQFKFNPVTLDPYILGSLLGDGGLSSGTVSFTTCDKESIDRINARLPEGYMLNSSPSMDNISYNIVNLQNKSTPNGSNIIKQWLTELNLMGTTSHNKFIPDEYKYNSPEIRLSVLQGLLDTDGYATKDNVVQYTTVSKLLADDVRYIVESLGGIVNWKEEPCGYNGKITSIAYTLTIRVDDPSELFLLTRKKELLKPRRFKPRRQIVKIERINNSDAKCITVDNKDHLYLAEHFVVTHNTKQAIDIAVARKKLGQVTQCLIICGVNSLKYNWLNEIYIHSDESGFILGMRQQKNGKLVVKGLKERIEDVKTHKEFFLICNIESLRDEEFVKQIRNNTNINMIIFDEFHHCNTPTSAQSRGLQKLSNYEYKIAMTGTPILNSPLDSYVALKWIGVENANYSTFKNYYCVYGGFGNHEVTGYKNLNLLRQSLSSCMIRRLKEEELDLPPKIEQTEIVELGSEQLKIYNEIKDEILNNIDLICNSPNPLTKLLRLRQATGYTGILSSTVKESAKFDRLEMMIADIVANDKKCIIFSNWTSITDPLIERLSKYKPAVITGEVSDAEREVQKKLFQNDPNCKVFIGTIGAAGTGLTLTAASYVFFLDLPWTYGNYAQAADRAHRIGTSGTVNIISLIARGTIDEKIWNLIHSKKDMSDMLVDGRANRKITKELLLELLS